MVYINKNVGITYTKEIALISLWPLDQSANINWGNEKLRIYMKCKCKDKSSSIQICLNFEIKRFGKNQIQIST